jgi:outer membrane protein, heavy metal efflux system
MWKYALGFAALLISTSARAESADAGMRAFVAEVIRQNPTLSARVLRRSAASREVSGSALWPDPQAVVMVDNLGGHEEEAPMVRFQLSQMIPWPGKLDLMEQAALRRTDVAGAEVKSRRLELELEAKRAYWMLALNASKRKINRANRGLVKTITSAALARYSAGSAGHHEVARAQVELNAVDVEAIALTGERASIVAMMNALRNTPVEKAIPDPSEPATTARLPPLPRLFELAAQRRPELEGMRAMQREEDAMAALARKERYPDLMTGVWYNKMIEGPEQSVGMMLGATIPVFGVRRQTRLGEAAGLRGRAVAQDAAGMRAMIRFEVADAVRKLTTAQRTLDFIRNSAQPRAQESFLSSLAGYSSGTVEITGLLESWRALQAAELARVEAAVRLADAAAELERAIGGPLGAA